MSNKHFVKHFATSGVYGRTLTKLITIRPTDDSGDTDNILKVVVQRSTSETTFSAQAYRLAVEDHLVSRIEY